MKARLELKFQTILILPLVFLMGCSTSENFSTSTLESTTSVEENYVDTELSTDALLAINSALEVEGWLPHTIDAQGNVTPTIVTNVRLLTVAELASLENRPGEGNSPSTNIWVISLQGEWYLPSWIVGEQGDADENVDQEIVYNLQVTIDAETGERISWTTNTQLPNGLIVPINSNLSITTYTVKINETLEEIATLFKLSPDSILMSNWDLLGGRSENITPGMELLIPPTDGALYVLSAKTEVWIVAQLFGVYQDNIWVWENDEVGFRASSTSSRLQTELEAGSVLFIQGISLDTFPR